MTQGSYVGTNPIWGDNGSPNAQDSLQVDLGAPTRLNDVKLYFYSNKQFGGTSAKVTLTLAVVLTVVLGAKLFGLY